MVATRALSGRRHQQSAQRPPESPSCSTRAVAPRTADLVKRNVGCTNVVAGSMVARQMQHARTRTRRPCWRSSGGTIRHRIVPLRKRQHARSQSTRPHEDTFDGSAKLEIAGAALRDYTVLARTGIRHACTVCTMYSNKQTTLMLAACGSNKVAQQENEQVARLAPPNNLHAHGHAATRLAAAEAA